MLLSFTKGGINLDIFERIKFLRKNALDYTQEEFANRIKISRSNLGSIEVGRINVTDRVIEDICTKFSVNENWLRYGEGDIFDEMSEDEEMMALIGRLCAGGNFKKKKALMAAAKIIENDICWGIIENELIKYISDNKKE